MKRTISIIIALLAILFALNACGDSQSSTPPPNPSTSPPDVQGTYSGTYQFGSDTSTYKMSLNIGPESGSSFTGQVELDTTPGSAICYSTNINIIDPTNVDQSGNITFSAYCGPNNPTLHFTGTAQNGGGWQGTLNDDNNNSGNWNVTPSSS